MMRQLALIPKVVGLFFFSSPGFAQEVETAQEIRVHLPTSSPLHPVYLGKIQPANSSFEATYLSELWEVFSFDLNHNGSMKVVGSSSEKEQELLKPFRPHDWKTFGVSFVIRWEVIHETLGVSVFETTTGKVKTFSEIALSGDLKRDRRLLHKLADGIHKVFFGSEGVASTRILFSYQLNDLKENRGDWVSEIWECDWDGANMKQLTQEKSYCVTPVALPPHLRYGNDHFLYVSYRMGQPKIYLGNGQGGRGMRLIDLRGNQLLPAISAQRDKIAFICDAAGRTDLFLQSFNLETKQAEKPVQLYSYPRATQASPTFSPDGSQLAFVSDKEGGMRIYIIPAVSTGKRANATLISKKNRENSCPAWSPDGTKLAYSAKTGGIRQIWIYDFATQEEWQLTSGPGNKENPSWAPNGKHLVFNSSDGASSELYLIHLNQAEAVKISRGPGKKHYPSWSARRG